MRNNLHTHTVRCRHARGTETEYVEQALKAGIQKLGFSDHTPQWFDGDYYSRFRMYPQQLTDYMDSVLALREQYADKITIHLGLEAEFYPKYFPELLSRLRDTPTEYLLLGQHYIGNEIGDQYSGWETDDPDHLRRYCKQVADAMYTGLFTYLAHPDLIHYVGDPALYRDQMRTVCKAAKDCDLPLELNLLGIREQRHYPNPDFWAVAAEENCTVILGIDAHESIHMNDPKTEALALEMANRYGLRLVEDTPLRRL